MEEDRVPRENRAPRRRVRPFVPLNADSVFALNARLGMD